MDREIVRGRLGTDGDVSVSKSDTISSNFARRASGPTSDLADHAQRVHYTLCMGGAVHTDWVRKVIYIPQTDYIISCSSSSENSMVLQDRSRKKKTYIYKVRKGVNCFDFNKTLNVIATGSTDHYVRLWNPYVESKPTAILKGHQTSILDVVINDSTGQLFSYSMDLFLKVYDIKEQTCLQTVMLKFPRGSRLPDHGPFVLHMQKKVANALIVCSNDCMAELKMGQPAGAGGSLKAVLSHERPISCCVYAPQTHQVMSGCEGSVVTVWDVNTGGRMLKLSNAHGDQEITCINIDSRGRRLLTGARNGHVKIWNFNNGHCLKMLEGTMEAEVTGITAFSDKNVIYTAGWNKCINVYRDDSETFHLKAQTAGWRGGNVHKEDILTTAYCPPNLLATASFDGEIVLWSTETQKILRRFRSGAKSIRQRGGNKRPSSRAYQERAENRNGYVSRDAHIWVASPVDKVIFLEERVREKNSEVSELVSSEAGHVYFWNIYGVSQCGGSFQVACRDGESVLAMTTDTKSNRLICGDTAGYIAVYDIRTFCISSTLVSFAPHSGVEQVYQRLQRRFRDIPSESPDSWMARCFDGEIVLWSTETQKILRRFRSGAKSIRQRGGNKRPSSRAYQERAENRNGASPVDKVIFLEERVREKNSEVSELVSSEAGHVYFWNIYGVSQCGGSFQVACRDGESVLAMTTDTKSNRLICGDTAGYIAVYDIRTFCISSTLKGPTPKRLTAWHGHSSAVTGLEFVDHESGMFLVSCSADCTIRMWNIHGHFVGTFGQDAAWSLSDRSTFKYPLTPFEVEGGYPTTFIPSIDGSGARPEDTQSASGGLQQQDQEIEDHLLNVNEMEAEAKILSV
eukprot:sb/3462021/